MGEEKNLTGDLCIYFLFLSCKKMATDALMPNEMRDMMASYVPPCWTIPATHGNSTWVCPVGNGAWFANQLRSMYAPILQGCGPIKLEMVSHARKDVRGKVHMDVPSSYCPHPPQEQQQRQQNAEFENALDMFNCDAVQWVTIQLSMKLDEYTDDVLYSVAFASQKTVERTPDVMIDGSPSTSTLVGECIRRLNSARLPLYAPDVWIEARPMRMFPMCMARATSYTRDMLRVNIRRLLPFSESATCSVDMRPHDDRVPKTNATVALEELEDAIDAELCTPMPAQSERAHFIESPHGRFRLQFLVTVSVHADASQKERRAMTRLYVYRRIKPIV